MNVSRTRNIAHNTHLGMPPASSKHCGAIPNERTLPPACDSPFMYLRTAFLSSFAIHSEAAEFLCLSCTPRQSLSSHHLSAHDVMARFSSAPVAQKQSRRTTKGPRESPAEAEHGATFEYTTRFLLDPPIVCPGKSSLPDVVRSQRLGSSLRRYYHKMDFLFSLAETETVMGNAVGCGERRLSGEICSA